MKGASAVDDRWIDSVAREMTEAPPPADLRARVLSQIAKDERTSKPLPRRLAPAAIALAAAAVLVATLWPQWRGEVPVQNQSATAAPPSTGAGVSREPEPAPVAQGATSPVQAQRTAPVVRSASALFDRPDTRVLAPPPLTVDAISDDPMEIPEAPAIGSLEITALGFTRLEIEPLAYQGDFQ